MAIQRNEHLPHSYDNNRAEKDYSCQVDIYKHFSTLYSLQRDAKVENRTVNRFNQSVFERAEFMDLSVAVSFSSMTDLVCFQFLNKLLVVIDSHNLNHRLLWLDVLDLKFVRNTGNCI